MTSDLAKRFVACNPIAAETLTADEIDEWAHYQGSAGTVLLGYLDDGGRIAVLHDTWGPGKPDEPGDVVVHIYDVDPDPDTYAEEMWLIATTFVGGVHTEEWGNGDTVAYFDTGAAAFAWFLERVDA